MIDLHREFRQTVERILGTTSSAAVACQEATKQLSTQLADLRTPGSEGVDAPPGLLASLTRLRSSADVIDALTRDLCLVLDALTKDPPIIN